MLVYERPGDFINWHYDVNYYAGRFFTLIAPLSDDDTCTTFMYVGSDGLNRIIRLEKNTAVLFEGEKVFHMASRICKGQTRVVLSMQFVTDPNVRSDIDSILLDIKDTVAFT